MVTVALVGALSGCSGEEPTGVVGTGAPVIVPGSPGGAGRTASPGETLAATTEPVAADVLFAESMIPHHRQALEMAGLAPGRVADPKVRAVAERIALTQEPEIRQMTTWLSALGRTAGHDHTTGMDGMATREQLNALRASNGTRFDRLFLELMIRHHEGALKMAERELAAGRDQQMRMMAREVYSGQSIEIARMKDLL